MEILDKLDHIKKALKEEEKRKMRFQGKLDAKMEALTDAGHTSVAKAKVHIKKLDAKLGKLVTSLDDLVEKFEEDYPQLVGDM